MKKLLFAAAALLAVATITPEASADGPVSPFGQRGARRGTFFFKHPLPAYQAAPWYSYWPYTAHFQTPAPLMGAFYAPPYTGGGMVNPYLPSVPAVPVAPVPVGGGN